MAAGVAALGGEAGVGTWARLTPPVVAERSLFNVQPLYLPSWLPAGFRYAGVMSSPWSEAAAQTTYRLGKTRIVWQDWSTGYPWDFDGRVISVGGRGVRYRVGMGLDDSGHGRDAVVRIKPSTVVRVWTNGPVAPRVLARVAASAVHVPASLQAPMPHFHIAQARVYGPESAVADVAVGDVTGDGRNDVLATTDAYFNPPDPNTLFVYPQRPDGTLGAPTRFKTDGGYGDAMPLVVGDFNGDGKTDVAVGAGPSIELFEQQHGVLAPAAKLPFHATELFATRLNGDRRSDLVAVGSRLVNGIWHNQLDDFVSTGSTGSEFAQHTLEALSDLAAAKLPVAVGDINGDRRQDLVTLPPGESTTDNLRLQALLQQRSGVFVRRQIDARLPLAFEGLHETGPLAIADLDSDHKPEIAFTSYWTRRLFVLHQRGSGLQYRVTDVNGITEPQSSGHATAFLVRDVNRDGLTDLVQLSEDSGITINWQLPNRQIGIYGYGYGNPQQTGSHALAVGDVNNDGKPDLISGATPNGFNVLYQGR